MNSTQAGNVFEERMFKYFAREIKQGRFIFRPECCRIFRKKGYYSRDRGKDIVFDISIEVYLPGSRDYSLLIVIECKNLRDSVPVDDAEEFFAKLQQVSGANIKGVIAATRAFQEGTLAFCRSKGIGLFRCFSERKMKWVLKRSASTLGISDLGINESKQIHDALTRPSYNSERYALFCCSGNDYTNSARKFFYGLAATFLSPSHLALIETPKPPPTTFVDFLTKEQIERRASILLSAVQYHHGSVDLDQVCKNYKDAQGRHVKVVRHKAEKCNGVTILGRINFAPPLISVSQSPEISNGRERFTLAHELGHLMLGHSKYLRAEYCEADDFKVDSNTFGDLQTLEWQANYFAACLLLPRHALVKAFCNFAIAHGIKERGWGYLFVDQQPCNQQNYYLATSHLKTMFGVSRSALTLRLREIGILNDAYGIQSAFNKRVTPERLPSKYTYMQDQPRRRYAANS